MKNGIKKEGNIKTAYINKLPEEILQIIYGYLSEKNLSNFSSCCNFFNESVFGYNISPNRRIKFNLMKHNCNKKILKLKDWFFRLYKWKNIVIADGNNYISAWKDSGEFLWDIEKKKHKESYSHKMWISDDKLISSHMTSLRNFDNITIEIYDINSKNCLKQIKDLGLSYKLTTVFSNQIIGKCQDGKIICLDLSGKLIKEYQSIKCNRYSANLLISNNYIVDIVNTYRASTINIINRDTNKIFSINLNKKVESPLIIDNLLIFYSSSTSFTFHLIDIKQPTKEKKIELPLTKKEIYEFIESMVANTQYIFAVPTTNRKLYMIDIDTNESKVLARLPDETSLYLKDDLLFIKIYLNNRSYCSIFIFDIKEMKIITNIDFNGMTDVLWDHERLFMTDRNSSSIIQCDFNVTHKGEKLIEDSANGGKDKDPIVLAPKHA